MFKISTGWLTHMPTVACGVFYRAAWNADGQRRSSDENSVRLSDSPSVLPSVCQTRAL